MQSYASFSLILSLVISLFFCSSLGHLTNHISVQISSNFASNNTISGKIAKEILPELIQKNISPKKLVEEKGLSMISDSSSILPIIDELITEHPDEVQALRNGKTKLLGFFVGQLMKRTKGKADPKLANKLLAEKLNS